MKRKNAFKLLVWIFFSVFCLEAEAQSVRQNSKAQYRIKITEERPKFIFVEAQIPVSEGHLFMNRFGADNFPNGWATFVQNLEIKDEKDQRLAIAAEPNASWQIAGKYSGLVKLSYQIDLSFVYQNWSAGNEQAGRFQDNSLFLVARPLFIVSAIDDKRQITFDLPGSWKVTTPWQKAAGDKFVFNAENQTDLLSNTIVLGQFAEYKLKKGALDFTLALPGKMNESAQIIVPALEKVLGAYAKLFDKTPPTNYLMTFFYDVQDDGEAYSRSAAFTARNKVTRNGLIIWGNFLAHEFFHFWNGQQMRGEPRETREWFNEGLSEYFANLTLFRAGLIGEDLFLKKMEKHLALYLYFKAAAPFQGTSIKQAGTRKSFNRPGVYNGGWTIAFCLDLLIREKTNGRRNLADFMRLMYEKFGLPGKPYSYQDIVRTASEIAGTEVADFFQRFVEGTEVLPVADYLEKLGLEAYDKGYAGEVYIFKKRSVNDSERKLWSALTGKVRRFR